MEKGIEIVGKIMYDKTITEAMVAGVPVVAFEVETKEQSGRGNNMDVTSDRADSATVEFI